MIKRADRLCEQLFHDWKYEVVIDGTLRMIRATCRTCDVITEEIFPPVPADPFRKLVWDLARKVHGEWDVGLIWDCESCSEVREFGADLVTPDDDDIRHRAFCKEWC